MGSKQVRSGPPDGKDVETALRAFETDMQLKARVIISPREGGGLVVTVESYREIETVRIGIAKHSTTWLEGSAHLLTRLLQSSYYTYHEAEHKAHQGTTPKGRNKK